jgi:putative endonuclease
MAVHNETGIQGEELAVKWLQQNGYEILHRNWRHSFYEIDIVASKIHPEKPPERRNFLHFIEVKTRHASPFGLPEDSVSRKKFKKLQKAADEYLFLNPGHQWIQYDVLSITLHKDKEAEFFLIEDVFL